jgi:hypothetical protein
MMMPRAGDSGSIHGWRIPTSLRKLPQSPFFKHDGPEVEIAAAGNFRIADQPDNSTQARFEYAVLSFHALSSGKALRGNRRVTFGTFSLTL